MNRLTRAEAEALDELVGIMAAWDRPELDLGLGAVPEHISFQPNELPVFERLNDLLIWALHSFAGKAGGLKKEAAAELGAILEAMTDVARETLSKPGRVAPFILAGVDANRYFAVLAWAHDRWAVIRKNFIETATNIKQAERQSAEALWAIRSLINVGHLPVEASRFLPPPT